MMDAAILAMSDKSPMRAPTEQAANAGVSLFGNSCFRQ
jgi:hypothetical protein